MTVRFPPKRRWFRPCVRVRNDHLEIDKMTLNGMLSISASATLNHALLNEGVVFEQNNELVNLILGDIHFVSGGCTHQDLLFLQR